MATNNPDYFLNWLLILKRVPQMNWNIKQLDFTLFTQP